MYTINKSPDSSGEFPFILYLLQLTISRGNVAADLAQLPRISSRCETGETKTAPGTRSTVAACRGHIVRGSGGQAGHVWQAGRPGPVFPSGRRPGQIRKRRRRRPAEKTEGGTHGPGAARVPGAARGGRIRRKKERKRARRSKRRRGPCPIYRTATAPHCGPGSFQAGAPKAAGAASPKKGYSVSSFFWVFRYEHPEKCKKKSASGGLPDADSFHCRGQISKKL